MKFFATAMSIFTIAWVSLVIGVAVADTGVGVCAAGQGFAVAFTGDGGPFTGANVGSPVADPTGSFGFGQGSTTGVYDSQADYEAQCCAETGQPADCFAPVQ